MYSASTLRRAATILRNEQAARQQATARTVKATVKRDRADWKNDPSIKASKGQMERINVAYGALNRRQYRTLASFRAVFASAGEASAEFQRPEVKAAYWASR